MCESSNPYEQETALGEACRNPDDDLLELAQHFGVRMCRELGWDYFPGFSAGAIRQLKGHRWPGNIRELKNVVERSLFRAGDTESLIKTIVIDPFARKADSSAGADSPSPHQDNEPRECFPPCAGVTSKKAQPRPLPVGAAASWRPTPPRPRARWAGFPTSARIPR